VLLRVSRPPYDEAGHVEIAVLEVGPSGFAGSVTQKKVKKQLRRMLDDFTAGTVLHFLADVFHEDAEEAGRAGDDLAAGQCRRVEAALFVLGLGIDAARPR
jgi:hypothetical protein